MKKFVLILMLMAVMMAPSFAGAMTPTSVVLTWDCTPTRTDGSVFNCLTEAAAYNVYYGTTSPPVTKITLTTGVFTPLSSGMTYTVAGLTPNQKYYFDVTVTDKYWQESAASNILAQMMPMPAPPGPPNLRGAILAFIGAVLAFVLKIFLV